MAVEYRVYEDPRGGMHVAQIVDGMVYELEPLPTDAAMEPGIYDAEWNLIERETPPWRKS